MAKKNQRSKEIGGSKGELQWPGQESGASEGAWGYEGNHNLLTLQVGR